MGNWKPVKISGHVVTEDNSVGLEGLIGLEVLNDYGNSVVKISKKTKLKRKKIEEDNESCDNDSDSQILKKKTKKIKKNGKVKAESGDIVKSNNEPEESVGGRFVLLKPLLTEDSIEPIKKKKKKNKNKKSVLNKDEKNDKEIPIEELGGWNDMGVPDIILKALAESGFKSPTQIQSLTLPSAIMGRRDILGAAETGSGKTLAFGIPILHGILKLKEKMNATEINEDNQDGNLTPPPEELENFPDVDEDDDEEDVSDNEANEKLKIKTDKEDRINKEKPLYALILTPTRELAVQVRDHIKIAAKYTGIDVIAVFGGLAAVKQERLLRKCPEIVVATPGRLWELLQSGNRHLNKVYDINYLVIDETDRMVEKGHFEELQKLLDQLNADEEKKLKRQNFIFSATLTMVHDLPEYLQMKNKLRKHNKILKLTPGQKIQQLTEHLGITKPKIVDITQKNCTAEKLTECRIVCKIDHKDFYLYYFLNRHPGRTIVFCNSIECVKRLTQLFSILNCQPLSLHANMIQKQRLKNLERFRDNHFGVLIATDVAARGLDIPNVEHVIHYQIPRTSENYVHRSGRTARANNEGITVLLMEPGEIKYYIKMCRTLGRSEDLPLFPISEPHLNVVKERVELAREIDIHELKIKRVQAEKGWKHKMAEEADMIFDDEYNHSDVDEPDHVAEMKKLLKSKRSYLAKLLSMEIFTRGFSYRYPTSTGKLVIPDIGLENNKEKAVNVMKNAINENEKLRKKKK